MEKIAGITIDLSEPWMGAFQRAGLAGIVCTLRWANANKRKLLGTWTVSRTALSIEWKKEAGPSGFLKELYETAFQFDNHGIYFIPGQSPLQAPGLEILSAVQAAIARTFYSHGPTTRGAVKSKKVATYQVDDEPVTYEYETYGRFFHRNAEMYRELVDKKTKLLSEKEFEYKSSVRPGAFVRHELHKSESTITANARELFCLHFGIVGCQQLLGPHRSGIILVPDYSDLEKAHEIRQAVYPATIRECHVSGAGDAALQAEIRIKARAGMTICSAMVMKAKPWSTQIKIRSDVIEGRVDDKTLDRYETILACLPAVCVKKKEEKKKKDDNNSHFWKTPVCRPLFADNLAKGYQWYNGFTKLMIGNENAKAISYEGKELSSMVKQIDWDENGAKVLVTAVHDAIRKRYGRIATEMQGNPQGMQNRFERERERWRIAFAGGKTLDGFRQSITDLWSRAGTIAGLQESWQEILPFISSARWKEGRDLALLALASYRGKEKIEETASNTEEE